MVENFVLIRNNENQCQIEQDGDACRQEGEYYPGDPHKYGVDVEVIGQPGADARQFAISL